MEDETRSFDFKISKFRIQNLKDLKIFEENQKFFKLFSFSIWNSFSSSFLEKFFELFIRIILYPNLQDSLQNFCHFLEFFWNLERWKFAGQNAIYNSLFLYFEEFRIILKSWILFLFSKFENNFFFRKISNFKEF